jgi:2-C-methyl-D-erythritol 4-phosphate cytidylyltransferase
MQGTMPKFAAVVVSAGIGQRMGADKAFLELGGKPLIAWSVDILQASDSINEIVLVLHKNKLDAGRDLMKKHKWSKITGICAGGELRQDSVRNGILSIGKSDWVLVHDGARPFLTEKLIADGIKAAAETGAAVCCTDVKDTMKLVDDNEIVTQTLNRNRLRAVQTPQVFRLDLLKKAYELISSEVTDDAGIVEKAGYRVKLYAGDYENIKITTPEDLLLAEIIAKGR